jgi:ssDNA-binding Zn-finger/Zn-ribbon topoisomerase 1
VLKRLFNTSERITHERLCEACARHNAQVFAKVRVADVLPIEGSGLPPELFTFALQSHYDFLVVGSDNVPLFAVEFDGPQHGPGRQAVRDARKNHLSDSFGLPLRRFREEDLRAGADRPDRLSACIEEWFNDHSRDRKMNAKTSCPLCGGPMLEKPGKYGRFLSCARYPACNGSRELPGAPPKMVYNPAAPRRPRVLVAGVLVVIFAIGMLAAVVRFQHTLFPGPASPHQPRAVAPESPAPFSVMTLADRRAYARTLAESEYPLCPTCGKRMVIRHNSRTGEPFFGCADFPSCRSTRDITYPR